jgi:lipopolysaccharide export system permease protein
MNRTIDRYIFNEIWPVFMAGMFIFLFIVLSGKMLNISEWIVTFSVRPSKIGIMIFYLIPGLVLFALPAVSLLAILAALLRMSGDNEIMALKSLGISLKQMLPAVLVVTTLSCLLAVFLSFYGTPWANNAFKNLILNIAQSKSDFGIKERIFCKPFNGITFYVQQFSVKDGIMRDVFIVDARDKLLRTTYAAKEGRILVSSTTKTINFQLSDVDVFRTEKGFQRTEIGHLGYYNFPIGINDIMPHINKRKLSVEEMPIDQLIKELQTDRDDPIKHQERLNELMQRFSIPLAVFLMGLIGFPLGAQIKSGGRVTGTVVSLLIFAVYYLMWAGIRGLGEIGILPAKYGTWVPVIFLSVSYFYLFKRAKEERSISLFETYFLRSNRK